MKHPKKYAQKRGGCARIDAMRAGSCTARADRQFKNLPVPTNLEITFVLRHLRLYIFRDFELRPSELRRGRTLR
jgi:hypothetical protein